MISPLKLFAKLIVEHDVQEQRCEQRALWPTLISTGLRYGPDEELDVPTRISLRPFVELLRLPLGLLAGLKASNLPCAEEHYRDHFVTSLFQQILLSRVLYVLSADISPNNPFAEVRLQRVY